MKLSILFAISSLVCRGVFAGEDRPDHLIVTQEEFDALSKETNLLEKDIPSAYKLTAFGIDRFYEIADVVLEADEAARSSALLDLLVLASEGKVEPQQRKFHLYTQITSATYYANLTKRREIVTYFKRVASHLVKSLESKDPVERESALRILRNLFPASMSRSADWFRSRLFQEDPNARLWEAIESGRNVVYPQDLDE